MASSGSRTLTNEEFLELVQNMSKGNRADKIGYVGNIGINPVFNQNMANLRSMKNAIEEELSDIEINLNGALIRDELELVTDELNDLNSRYSTLSDEELQRADELVGRQTELNRQKNEFLAKTGKSIDDIGDANDLMEKANSLTYEELQLRARINKLNKEINKELEYQNKKEEHSLSVQERIAHVLDSKVLNTTRFMGGINEAKAGIEKITKAAKELLEPWGKLDQASANYARQIGLSGAGMRQLRRSVIETDNANSIAAITGLSPEEQIKAMGGVTEGIGRQIGFNSAQQTNMAYGMKLLGNENALQFIQKLENFGVSTSEAMDRVADLFKDSEKSGVAFSKTSKIMLDNIKLAQNYTFRNGLQGLSEMSKRSAEIKMDLGEVSRFVEKTSSLEGSLQAAAGLSVLGGPFAMGANPLQMLYNGLNDFEGASKQMENMVSGLVSFNKETKQLEMSAFNRMRMRAAAQAMGVNYDQLMEMAFAKGREGQIAPILRNMGIDSNSSEYQAILNRAYLDKEGNAKINVNGQEKNVSELTAADRDIITRTNFDDSDNIKTITSTLLGWDDLIKGTKEGIEARRAYQAEVTGIGEKAKSVIELARDNYKVISDILSAVKLIQILLGGLMVGNGLVRSAQALGGTRPPALSYSPTPSNGMGGLNPSSAAQRRSFANSMYTQYRAQGKGRTQSRQMTAAALSDNGVKPSTANHAARGAAFRNRFSGINGGAIGGISGAAGAIGGSMLKSSGMEDMASGDAGRMRTGVTKSTVGGVLEGAGYGAMMGAMFGGVGALVGAAIGGIAGGIMSYSSSKEMQLRNLIAMRNNGLQLQGNYSLSELKKIAGGYDEIKNDPDLANKLFAQEGLNTAAIKDLKRVEGYKNGGMFTTVKKPKSMATGGVLHGRGTGTSDSNLAWLSNNEYIMPAAQTLKPNNRRILDSMRNGDNLIPSFSKGGINIMPAAQTLKPLKVSDQTSKSSNNISVGEIKIAPIDISGTIKLDLGGYSKGIDAKQLLNNPMFVKEITDMIAKNLNRQKNFGYDKNEFYKKFGG